MKVIIITNSDFGKEGTIGFRSFCVARECYLRENLKKVFCRGNFQKEIPKKRIQVPFPGYRSLNLLLSVISQFLIPSFSARPIQKRVFDKVISQQLSSSRIELTSEDIVHSWEYAWETLSTAKKRGATTILDMQTPVRNKPTKKQLLSVDYFLAPSDFVIDSLRKLNIPSKKIIKIPFGVDTDYFHPSKYKNEKFICLFAGQLELRKGIDYLLRAWKELNLSNAELWIVGRPHHQTNKLRMKYKNDPSIRFFGNVKQKTLAEIYRKSDVFVFPSLSEGSAKVVYEALSSGIPVICTYESGSIIEDEKEGFIIKAKNISSLKKNILKLYNNPKIRETMGRSARRKAEKYNWSAYSKKINDIYTQVKR